MPLVDLVCPTCGQQLRRFTFEPPVQTDVQRDGVIGGHVHVEMSGTVSCSNGHQWEASGMFTLTRKA